MRGDLIMIEVLNKARAKVAGVLPGKVGMVDEANPSVVDALRGGALVRADEARAKLLAEMGMNTPALAAEVEMLRAENASLKTRLAGLEAKAPAKAAAKAPAKAEG